MITTVGYGDFYAKTHMGRLITVISAIVGNFLTSLTIVALTISSELTQSEYRAY